MPTDPRVSMQRLHYMLHEQQTPILAFIEERADGTVVAGHIWERESLRNPERLCLSWCALVSWHALVADRFTCLLSTDWRCTEQGNVFFLERVASGANGPDEPRAAEATRYIFVLKLD